MVGGDLGCCYNSHRLSREADPSVDLVLKKKGSSVVKVQIAKGMEKVQQHSSVTNAQLDAIIE